MVKTRQKNTSDKPIMICTLDTETRGLFGEVFRVGLYNGIEYNAFDTFGECYRLLKQYAKTNEVHVYIHNLDFDLSKIAGTILPDMDIERCIFIDHNVAVFATINNIILHDSLKLLPSSLEKICKDFGLGEASKIDLTNYLQENGYKDKGDYFNRVSPDEEMLNIYLKFDCTSLYTVIIQLIDISGLTVEEFLTCPTAASLALKVFKELYPDDYADACSTNYRGEFGQLIETVVRQAYFGGRTEVFQPELLKGYHYDDNSLYPFIMKVNEFPIGYYDVYQGKKAQHIWRAWLNTHKGAGFISCKVHVPENLHIPPLPHKTNSDPKLKNKLLFPVGNLHGTWTFPEMELAIEYGCKIIEVEQVIYFSKTYPIFKEFVLQFEELKVTSKGAKRAFAKLVQNSLYGKFGMIRMRRKFVSMNELPDILESGEKHLLFQHPKIGVEMVQVEREAHAAYIQPHIAAYVTSLARCLLYRTLVNESNGDVAYCDTDSIVCENQLDDTMIHESEYGKWKLENVVKDGIFLQPKLYFEKPDLERMKKEFPDMYNDMTGKIKKKYGDTWEDHIDELNTIRAKGVPADIKSQFKEETYKTILRDIKKGKEKIMFFGTENSLFAKEKKVRQKFVSLLKSGASGQDGFDEGLYIKKGMNLRAKQKRVIDYKNNTSRPHCIYDF